MRTCAPFEPVRCDTFITESTFGLPIYRWPSQPALFAEIDAWWRRNAEAGRASVLLRLRAGQGAAACLDGVDASIGPIVAHGAVEPLNAVYRAAGRQPAAHPACRRSGAGQGALSRALVIAPPSAASSPWLKRFGPDLADARQRLDVAARHAAAARRRPLRDVRPCRLAGLDGGDPGSGAERVRHARCARRWCAGYEQAWPVRSAPSTARTRTKLPGGAAAAAAVPEPPPRRSTGAPPVPQPIAGVAEVEALHGVERVQQRGRCCAR